jgi:CDP-6-deoxy-D-xylo-4-hexulose-3-dehydrase
MSDLRQSILSLVWEYAQTELQKPEERVRIGGRVYGPEEVVSLVEASLDFWLTADRYAEEFSGKLKRFLGVRDVLLCNSGSSANLLAITALTAKELSSRYLQPKDEVITVAAGFPTTVNGIYQNDLVPVFVDIELDSYNIDVKYLEEAKSELTKAVMLAHTLGHPFDVETVKDFCTENSMWLIEDNCDALGSQYKGKHTGTFGNLATESFFPAHHITTGQGGAVMTNSPRLAKIVESFRDWGRDCWCLAGKQNTCGKRYGWELGDLPFGYDHKYIYSHIGYNLAMTDLQAAIGCAQMDKLPGFISTRRRNWWFLRGCLHDSRAEKFFVLPVEMPNCSPSWFGFALRVKSDAPFTRLDVIKYLDSKSIDSRLLFAGNLTKQPAYQDRKYRVVGSLTNTDDATMNTFWLGVYPGLGEDSLTYVADALQQFVGMY